MKVEKVLPFPDPKNTHRVLERVHKVLSGNISYGTLSPVDKGRNIDVFPATATTPGVINTEFAVSHGLNRIPVGFHLINKSGSVDVYQSTTAWTKNKIFLKATVININITLLIF